MADFELFKAEYRSASPGQVICGGAAHSADADYDRIVNHALLKSVQLCLEKLGGPFLLASFLDTLESRACEQVFVLPVGPSLTVVVLVEFAIIAR
jgi:hypothetical protein